MFPFQKILSWYEINGRKTLPWRWLEHYSEEQRCYYVWLSEIFLQQTQVSRVIEYFNRITQAYPNIHCLAKASYDEFFPYYQWLGYYSRARNLLKTAKIISEEFHGVFPKTKDELIKLPWIWEYTANAILSFALGNLVIAWDTNIEKIFARYYTGSRFNKLTKEIKQGITYDFQQFFKKKENQIYIPIINGAFMDFSSIIDVNNKTLINWEEYPLKESLFYTTEWIKEEMAEVKKIYFPLQDAKVVVILHENHREYFSKDIEKYTPFILNPLEWTDIRKWVQSYFRETYELEVSVRPVHHKWLDNKGDPYIACNAQIQTGTHKFARFRKDKEIQNILKQYKKNQD